MYTRIYLKIIWVTGNRWEYKWDGEAKYLFLLNLNNRNTNSILAFYFCMYVLLLSALKNVTISHFSCLFMFLFLVEVGGHPGSLFIHLFIHLFIWFFKTGSLYVALTVL